MVKIWNKKESINGVDAEEALKDRPDLRNNDDIILIYDENNVVTSIQIASQLKCNYGFNSNLSPLDTGIAFEKYLKERNSAQPSESQEERIKSLENTILELKEVI